VFCSDLRPPESGLTEAGDRHQWLWWLSAEAGCPLTQLAKRSGVSAEPRTEGSSDRQVTSGCCLVIGRAIWKCIS